MLKSLASLLRKKPADAPPLEADAHRDRPPVVKDENTPIYEALAMTEELREALFPKSPQMVSAIFDRPPPLVRPPAAPARPLPVSPDAGSFPIV